MSLKEYEIAGYTFLYEVGQQPEGAKLVGPQEPEDEEPASDEQPEGAKLVGPQEPEDEEPASDEQPEGAKLVDNKARGSKSKAK